MSRLRTTGPAPCWMLAAAVSCRLAAAAPPNCGVTSAMDLALPLGASPDSAQRGRLQAAHSDPEASILDVRRAAESVGIALAAVRADTVSLKPGTLVGEFADELSIQTTHKDRPLITIPIRGTVRPDLILTPSSVFFGFVKKGAQAAATVTVRSRSGAPFRLLKVAPGDPAIQVSQSQTDGGYRLDITVPSDKLGVLEGEVTLTTDVPLEETVCVLVYVHVVE